MRTSIVLIKNKFFFSHESKRGEFRGRKNLEKYYDEAYFISFHFIFFSVYQWKNIILPQKENHRNNCIERDIKLEKKMYIGMGMGIWREKEDKKEEFCLLDRVSWDRIWWEYKFKNLFLVRKLGLRIDRTGRPRQRFYQYGPDSSTLHIPLLYLYIYIYIHMLNQEIINLYYIWGVFFF